MPKNDQSDEPQAMLPVSFVAELLRVMRIAREDIEAALDQEYPQELRERYPTYARRYDNSHGICVDLAYCADVLRSMASD